VAGRRGKPILRTSSQQKATQEYRNSFKWYSFLCFLFSAEYHLLININVFEFIADIHNVIPGKYATVSDRLSKELVVSLIIKGNQQILIVCKDERQRDNILDTIEVLMGIPLLRCHHY
jgi:arginine repressor